MDRMDGKGIAGAGSTQIDEDPICECSTNQK